MDPESTALPERNTLTFMLGTLIRWACSKAVGECDSDVERVFFFFDQSNAVSISQHCKLLYYHKTREKVYEQLANYNNFLIQFQTE